MQTQKILKWCAWRFGILIILFLLVFIARRPLMRATANFLIHEDELIHSDAIFVLSGNPTDRAAEAARLLQAGYAEYVVCTGEQVPALFEVIDVTMDEADLSKISLCEAGIPEEQIEVLHVGSSTREEANAILMYCQTKGLDTIMVVSDKFHTHRINYAFRDLFDDAGIQLVLRGGPSSAYREDLWWAEESGLLMVNNEYVKLFYYFLKY